MVTALPPLLAAPSTFPPQHSPVWKTGSALVCTCLLPALASAAELLHQTRMLPCFNSAGQRQILSFAFRGFSVLGSLCGAACELYAERS